MVRLNGMMFYSVAIASFLESTAPLDATRLARLSEGDADAAAWVRGEWLAGRAAHGGAFREYIETTWPEFDWNSAYQAFRASYLSRTAAYVGPPGLALEVLARCVTETTLAIFYRTLAKSADDPALRQLAGFAAAGHAAYFDRFRAMFERIRGRRRAGLAASYHAVFAACRAARDVDVAAAFQPLARHWHGGWVFPELAYPEFLGRLAFMIRRNVALGFVERLLFRAWLNPPRSVEAGRQATPALRAA